MRNIVLLGLTSLLTDISSEMVYPLLPFFLTISLGASPAVLGFIEGMAESLASLLKVYSGYLSDRFRRRKEPTIVGYATSLIGKLLLYAAGTWVIALAARLIDRLGKGVRTAPRDALIAESSPPEHRGRAFGLHRAMDTAGAAIGVILAYGIISGSGGNYTTAILWSVVPAAAGVLLLMFVRETRTRTEPVRPLPRLRWRTLPRNLRIFLGITLLFAVGNSTNTFLLLRAADVGFTPADAILFYLAYNLSYAVWSYPAGRLSDRLGRKRFLVLGYGLYAVVYAGFALLGTFAPSWLPWLLFILYGGYSACTDGVEKALITDLAPQHLKATAIGLHAFLIGIGVFPASFLAGILWTQVAPEAALAIGVVTGAGAASTLALFRLDSGIHSEEKASSRSL